ncbi:LytR/AlgR family response regulator transcription factor [Tenacibaculum maritimum]|uniref:LytR/AlgR family response regulator transcription factor n=1 Tax=Tenacibaculum maritimum TaxID=107401 RepID=UPI0012E4C432|nr:LytTR family DNA-binding domain-containing protein [Tenacibaculum maritimum]MCD9581547.1 LytTR family DNA-binding domain-containing protein [Tenacibaculum maritimum]MCD9636085.1 LytTR family DNA-binding domain-containing protein [Tenacibaculum maritimum]MDB0601192.1 LytTR family DNA-binding domain-containing protein [Tenacibaculum maritimum]MDB0613541.1 LytTR family DNA-binding domain-containing protein [Tenacibaculum maritimum]CAA0152930.1 Two-component system response regulatory protein, 
MLKIVLIDDERDALEALEWKIKRIFEDVHITKCSSPIIGIKLVKEIGPEIVFLDIQMPEMDGFSFISQFSERNFKVVFTTAYDEYGIKAIKAKAFDYLLKPIDIDELTLVLVQVKKEVESRNVATKINISADGRIYLISKETVLYLKSDGSYTSVYLISGKKIIATKTLKDIQKKFNYPEFFRVHNSYVINLDFVIEYNKGVNELTMKDGARVSVSRSKKSELMEKLYLDK